jgi:hypothetical protein
VPHDLAHAHPVRARPLRLRLPKVEAPRRRPLAWDLHIVGALALRRHARRTEVMDARLQGLHSCSAALGGCTLCASASVAVGDGGAGAAAALDGHSRTANGHESECGLLIKGFRVLSWQDCVY